MFKKEETGRRKRGGFLPIVLFRLSLSMCILAIFALGVYQAFRYFTGQSLMDLTRINPREVVVSLLTSDDISKTISGILGVSVPTKNLLPGSGSSGVTKPGSPRPTPSGSIILKFAVIADSHSDNEDLGKALAQAKENGAKFVIGLGDYSDTGTLGELEKAKEVFSASGLPTYLTAGDHDLWDSRDKGKMATANFSEVFGSPYQSFTASNIRFILLFNGDNYEGVDSVQRAWLDDLLHNTSQKSVKETLVFLHEPLYHPTSDRFMGAAIKTDEGKEANKELTKQAEELRDLFKRVGVAGVFAGDIHAYSNYDDPQYGLRMVTAGAVTSKRNSQKPRYMMVDVYEDGGYNISDIEIK